MSKIPVVGLAGGIGSGKSMVAGMLANLGARVIDSDELNQQELCQPEVKSTLTAWWGPDVMTSAGDVNRGRVAEIVFRDPAQKERLEKLLHPRIEARRRQIMAELAGRPDVKMVLLDAPLLFEAGLDAHCDRVIFVEAPPEQRAARVRATRGWSAEEWARRENLQWPLDSKRARADYICSNNSDVAALRRQVEAIFSLIVSGAG